MFNIWEELVFQREKNGLTLDELSKLSSIPLGELEKLEMGLEEVNEVQLELLANTLNISPIILLGMETTNYNDSIEARFRIHGNKDVNLEKSFNFAVEFINKLQDLKILNSLD
jgi:transcriptional regulator with XRE-family HTH domain